VNPTDTDQVRTLLADHVQGDPPVALDVDDVVTRGRRRVRRRTAAVCAAAVLVPAIAFGGALTLAPVASDRSQVATTPGPDLPGEPIEGKPSLPQVKAEFVADLPGTPESLNTNAPIEAHSPKSRALLAQLRNLIPEMRKHPEMKAGDSPWTDGNELTPHLTASWSIRQTDEAAVRKRIQETGMSINSVGVEMGARDKGIGVPGCWKGDDYQCSGARRFPDGSIALYKEFRSEYQGSGEMTHSYSVNLIRPDGTEIHVYSEVVYQPDRPRNALLSLPRLMQIARGITVTP